MSNAKPSVLDRNIKYKLTTKGDHKNYSEVNNSDLNDIMGEYRTVTALPVMLLDSNQESLEMLNISNEYSC